MTYDQFLARAAEADGQADGLFERMRAASEAASTDLRGFRRMIPAGWEARAQEASDLRRQAERLRAEAEDMKPTPIRMSASPAPISPPPLPIAQTPAAAAASPPPKTKPDPIEAIVARIMEA